MTYEPKNAYRTRTYRTERYLKDVVLLKNNSSRVRERVCTRGEAIRAALRAVSWPLRTSAMRRRLVAW